MTKKFLASVFVALSVVIFSVAQVSAKAPLTDIGIYKFLLNLGYKINKNALMFDPGTNQIVFIDDLNEQPLLPAGYPMTHNTIVYADKQSGKVTELSFVFHTTKGTGKVAEFLSKVFNALDSDTFSANQKQIEQNIAEVLKGRDKTIKDFYLQSADRGYNLRKNYIGSNVLAVHIQCADPSLKENLLREEKERESTDIAKQLEPLLQSKKYSEAADLCKTLIQRHPDNGAGYYGLGFCYYTMGKYSEAIEQLKKAASLTPNSDTYKFMGLSYAGINDANNAVTAFNKALELNPKNHQAYYCMALVYANLLNAPDKAAECCEKAIAIYPRRDHSYYYVLGCSYIRTGNFSRAIENLSEAVKLNDKDYHAYIMRAFAYENLGDLNKAKKDYEAALKRNPNSNDAASLREKLKYLSNVAAPITKG